MKLAEEASRTEYFAWHYENSALSTIFYDFVKNNPNSYRGKYNFLNLYSIGKYPISMQSSTMHQTII